MLTTLSKRRQSSFALVRQLATQKIDTYRPTNPEIILSRLFKMKVTTSAG